MQEATNVALVTIAGSLLVQEHFIMGLAVLLALVFLATVSMLVANDD